MWNHGTHGTHEKEHGGNRWDGGNLPRVTEPMSETFAPQRDLGMTLRFLSFSVYSVYSVVPYSGLRTWSEITSQFEQKEAKEAKGSL